MRELDESVLVDCVFSVAMGYVERYFEEHSSLELRGLGILTTSVDADARLATDGSDSTRHHDAVNLTWKAAPGLPLPDFAGHVVARPHFDQTELRLVGRYEPPLGALGAAFDAIAGREIAAGTARELLGAIKIFVESRRNADRARYPTDAQLNAEIPPR